MENYSLERFRTAQRVHFDSALSEIQAGEKESCWMWFIFPQLKALGQSDTAKYYGIADLAEAKAYMADPVLRSNLLTITRALLKLEASDPAEVMGVPDDEKLRSCMTLFELAAPDVPEFTLVLEKYFNGVRDEKTTSGAPGHFSAGFTLDTYAHVTTAAQKEAAITMGNVLSL